MTGFQSSQIAIEKVGPNYNYLWIGLNYTQSSFHITARDASIKYGGALYVMGGVPVGNSHSLHGALITANTLSKIRLRPFTHGVRVSEEAMLKQMRDDWVQEKADALSASRQAKVNDMQDAFDAYHEEYQSDHPGLYTIF